MKKMTISNAARQADVVIETIRFYERLGLIEQPLKPDGAGFRVYPDATVQRVRFIRHAQELGFSLREINDLLSLRADPTADSADVLERATTKLEEVDRKIVQLGRVRAALEQLIAACPGHGGLQACSIMDALLESSDGTPRRPEAKQAEAPP